MRVINAASQFVFNVSSSGQMVSEATLSTFARSLSEDLMENAREAVRDYLTWQVHNHVVPVYALPVCSCMWYQYVPSPVCSLNATITDLLLDQNITEEEWQTMRTVVEVEPFARPRSFIVQVYLIFSVWNLMILCHCVWSSFPYRLPWTGNHASKCKNT